VLDPLVIDLGASVGELGSRVAVERIEAILITLGEGVSPP